MRRMCRSLGVVLAVLAPLGAITVTDNHNYEGRSCFRIVTTSATYVYDKRGGGLARIIDNQGNDWIGFHNDASTDQAGEYRGIPNLGDCCHPGYPEIASGKATMVSTVSANSGSHIVLTSTSTNNSWKVVWDFYETYVTLTVEKIAAGKEYYVLYEGTPGGQDGLSRDDFYVTSDGRRRGITTCFNNNCSTPTERLSALDWIFFSGKRLKRSLLLIQHTHDNILDCYWPMNNPAPGNMTVFGFGRDAKGDARALTTTPNMFHFALIEDTTHAFAATMAQQILNGSVATLPTPTNAAPTQRTAHIGSGAYDIRGRLLRGGSASVRSAGVYAGPTGLTPIIATTR